MTRIKEKKYYPAVVVAIVLLGWILKSSAAQAATDFSSLLAGVGTSPVTVTVEPGDYNVSSSLDVPANVTLYFKRGALVHLMSGATLHIRGPINDCKYRIFDDQNTDYTKGVKFAAGNMPEVRPEWWGARGNVNYFNESNDFNILNTKAINQAINSHDDYRTTVVFLQGDYRITGPIVVRGSTNLRGSGNTNIGLGNYANKNMLEDAAPISSDQSSTISGINFGVSGQSPSPSFDIVHLSHGSKNWTFKNCAFTENDNPMIGWSIFADGINNIKIEDSYVQAINTGGIYFGNLSGGQISFVEFSQGGADNEYAVQFQNCQNCVLDGSIVYGGSDPTLVRYKEYGMLVAGGSGNKISNNRFDLMKRALLIDSSNLEITANEFTGMSIGGVYSSGSCNNVKIQNNRIFNGEGDFNANYGQEYGISLSGTAAGTEIKDNVIYGFRKGGISWSENGTGNNYPLIEKNQFVDADVLHFPVLESNSTPRVTIVQNWETQNASPVTITNFWDAPVGKEIFVKFNDDNTTIHFWNNPALSGNSGLDWKPANGDHMRCTKQSSGSWNCNAGNDTGNGKSLPPPADLNEDGKIDGVDLGILKADFLKTTDSLSNPKSDIDRDGTVNVKDLGSMMSQWKP